MLAYFRKVILIIYKFCKILTKFSNSSFRALNKFRAWHSIFEFKCLWCLKFSSLKLQFSSLDYKYFVYHFNVSSFNFKIFELGSKVSSLKYSFRAWNSFSSLKVFFSSLEIIFRGSKYFEFGFLISSLKIISSMDFDFEP